jgi:hypothetical protein
MYVERSHPATRETSTLLSQMIDYLEIMSLINLCKFTFRLIIAYKCTERDSFGQYDLLHN